MTNPRYQPPRAAYVHVPFCRHRCGYCNFTLVAGRDDLISDYLSAIESELQALEKPCELDTLFLGGGTPSHLTLAELEQLLSCLRHWFLLDGSGEYSIEANPADLSKNKVELLADFGVTRLSIGAQSFDDSKLRFLERDHRGDDIQESVKLAADAGLNVSLDLIFGIPHETETTWLQDLKTAIQLAPGHLSTYGLTYERGARFWSRVHRGQLQPLSDAQEARLYELAIERLAEAGFEHYEVSNFSQPGHRCRHNLNYWDGGTYLAFGPGAASHVDGTRRMNHGSTTAYLRKVLAGESPVADEESLTPRDAARERLVFGLRMLVGIDRDRFQRETGFSVDELAGGEINELIQSGLLGTDGPTIRVTQRGLMVCDSIAETLLANV